MRSTAAARGSQSATEPIMVEAEVAEKKPNRIEMIEDVMRRRGDESNLSTSFDNPVRRYVMEEDSSPYEGVLA